MGSDGARSPVLFVRGFRAWVGCCSSGSWSPTAYGLYGQAHGAYKPRHLHDLAVSHPLGSKRFPLVSKERQS